MIEIFQNLFSPPRHMILLVISMWLGLTLAERRSQRHGISSEDLNNLSFYGLLAFVIGGRLLYVIENISAFTKSPLSVFSINPTLFDAVGGIVIAVIAVLVYSQNKELHIWSVFDSLTPLFAVISIGLGLSHLAVKTAFGTPTTLPWGIEMWNETRHPVQIYETLASFLLLGLLWRFKQNLQPGITFLTFAALTAFSNLFLQTFRADYTAMFNTIRQEQVILWFVLLACFILIEIQLNKNIQTSESKTG